MADQNEQLRFLSQTAFIEEATTPYKLKFTLYCIFGALIAFIIWASFANVKEIVKTTGKVIPSGLVQTIQHLEGGVVKTINVQEGQIVKTGDVLLRIDDTNILSEFERLEVKQFGLKIREERLSSIAEDRKANFGQISNQYPSLVRQQEEIIRSFQKAQNEEKAIIERQLDQKRNARDSLLRLIETTRKNVAIALENYNLEKEAFEGGIGLKTSFLNAKSNYINQKGELERLDVQIKAAEDQISEFESRLASQGFTSKDRVQQELAEVKNQIAENEKTLVNLKNRVEKLTLKSPVNGIVKGLTVTTIGAVIPPGQKIMEVVPTDQELIAEVKIFPHDVGHVKVGDHVNLKLTTFDFSRYGTIDGFLDSVSATTFSTERGDTYYKGFIVLTKNYVGDDPKKNIILPGMEVLGDIVTGDKTVMDYLLKPIHVSLHGAFSER